MDYGHRRHKSVAAVIPPGADDDTKQFAGQMVSAAWEELETQLLDELIAEGFTRDQISLRQIVYMKYFGHLDDLEIASPVERLNTVEDVDKLVDAFVDVFTRTYTLAGKPPVPTYQIEEVSIIAEVSTVKPRVGTFELEGKEPSKAARKGTRQPVHLVEHDDVYPRIFNVRQQPLQCGALHATAGVAPVIIRCLDDFPSFVLLARDIGLAGLPLGMERVELLVQTFLGRFAGIDGAADRMLVIRLHGAPPTLCRSS